MNETAANDGKWTYHPGLFGGGNYTLHSDDFYISYAPRPCGGFSMLASDDGSSETALCKDGKFHILNGDFRADYERLLPQGFDACMAFFREHETAHRSSWSTAEMDDA